MLSCLRRSSPSPAVLTGTNGNAGLSICSDPLTLNGIPTGCCHDNGLCESSECSAVKGINSQECTGAKCPGSICKVQVPDCVGSNCFGRVACANGSSSCPEWNKFCIVSDKTGTFKTCAGSSCAHVKCLDGGRPKFDRDGMTCPEGALVYSCAKDVADPCRNMLCKNGGSCDGGKCICATGFFGSHCEVDACTILPCLNKSKCEGGKCRCAEGFTGSVCEISTDPCRDVVCNNGTCKNGSCACNPGFSGPRCEKRDYPENNVFDTSVPRGDVVIQNNCATKPGSGWVTLRSTEMIIGGGVHEWSIKVVNLGISSDHTGFMLGIMPKSFSNFSSYMGAAGGWSVDRSGYFRGAGSKISGAVTFTNGDLVVLQLDMPNAQLKLSVGGQSLLLSLTGLPSEVYPGISVHYPGQHVCFESRRMIK